MNILNLYCGIGGNRKFWDKEHTGLDLEVTAIELNPQIAKIYQDFFPNDKVIVADAQKNCVEPPVGLHILNESKREVYKELFSPQPKG